MPAVTTLSGILAQTYKGDIERMSRDVLTAISDIETGKEITNGPGTVARHLTYSDASAIRLLELSSAIFFDEIPEFSAETP